MRYSAEFVVITCWLIVICGCSEEAKMQRFEAAATNAVLPQLAEGERIHSLLLDEAYYTIEKRPRFTVKVCKEHESRGGRRFTATYDGKEWYVIYQMDQWLEYHYMGPDGYVLLGRDIDVETATSVLWDIEKHLRDGEYFLSVNECVAFASEKHKGEASSAGLVHFDNCVRVTMGRDGHITRIFDAEHLDGHVIDLHQAVLYY